MTSLTNGVCAVRERIPVRILLITLQIVNAFDVNVIYAKPYSQTTKTTENSTLSRRPYLTLATPHIAGVTLRRKKLYVNDLHRSYLSNI